MGLPGAPAGGHGELVFPTVDSGGGRSVGAGRGNRPYVAGVAIAPAQGHHAWTGSPAPLAVCGPHTACRARRRSRYRETAPPWFQLPWPRSRACHCPAVDLGTPPPGESVAEPARRPSASPHDRRTCNRPETGTRLSLSPSWSPPSSNGLIETSRRGGESRSLALVPAARKAPASFSRVARRDLAGAARLLCNFHACGPEPGSMPGSVGAQVLTFGMSSQRVV